MKGWKKNAGRRRSSSKYELSKSPFFRLERKKDLAKLLRLSPRGLDRLLQKREASYLLKRERVGEKERDLAVPVRDLRRCHERLLVLLRRIELPDHIRCPKQGSSPAANALAHRGQAVITAADIKDFYPSTTEEHVFRFFKYRLEMSDDNARILARLTTIGGRLPVGSPVSPHLAALTHLDIFDEAAGIAIGASQNLTIWVDDVAVSGKARRRDIVASIRRRAAAKGFSLHKLRRGGGRRPINLTGSVLRGDRADVVNASHVKLRDQLVEFHEEIHPGEKLRMGNRIIGLMRHQRMVRKQSGLSTIRLDARINWLRRRMAELASQMSVTEPDAEAQKRFEQSPADAPPF